MIRHHSSRRGPKSVDLTIVAIARAFACCLCYQHLRKSTTIFSEYFLRIPLVEIAQARQWDCECEFRLFDDPAHSEGSYKKIDFVLSYFKQVIGIEMKFPNSKGKPRGKIEVDLTGDVHKLRNLFPKETRIKGFIKKYAFIMVAADEDVFSRVNYKGIEPKKKLCESDIKKNDRTRNVLDKFDSFVTMCIIGNRKFFVEAIKVDIPKKRIIKRGRS